MTTAQERADLLDKLGLDTQNKAALGRVLGTGNIGQATERSDGRMQATIRINPTSWPGIPRFWSCPTEVISSSSSSMTT